MFWKIFFGVWLCSWKYHRKHIFYLLLTFSQLPNKYIISFLNTETQKKQNPEKNSSNLVKLREEGRERGDWVRSRGEITRWRRDWAALESIFAWSAWCDRRNAAIDETGGVWVVGLELDLFLLTVSLSLSLSLCASEAQFENGLKWK